MELGFRSNTIHVHIAITASLGTKLTNHPGMPVSGHGSNIKCTMLIIVSAYWKHFLLIPYLVIEQNGVK